jgi:hypothetical protein
MFTLDQTILTSHEQPQKIVELSRNLMTKYNCAESILLAFSQPSISPWTCGMLAGLAAV